MKKYLWSVFMAVMALPCFAANDSVRIDDIYQKKATWRETAVAAREAFRESYAKKRLAEVESLGVTFKWSAAGPYKGDDKGRLNFKEDKANKSFTADGQSPVWKDIDPIPFCTPVDAAPLLGMKAEETYIIKLEVSRSAESKGNKDIYIGLSSKYGRIQNQHRAGHLQVRRNDQLVRDYEVAFDGGTGEHTRPGQSYNLFVSLKADKEGKCELILSPRHGRHADGEPYVAAINEIYDRVRSDFDDVKSRTEMDFEFSAGIWLEDVHHTGRRAPREWWPGLSDAFFKKRIEAASNEIFWKVKDMAKTLTEEETKVYQSYLKRVENMDRSTAEGVTARFYAAAAAKKQIKMKGRIANAILAVKDQVDMFGGKYTNGEKNLAALEKLQAYEAKLTPPFFSSSGTGDVVEKVYKFIGVADKALQSILLQNPVLPEKLVMVRGKLGITQSWNGADKYGSEVVTMSPVSPDGEFTVLHQATHIHYGKKAPLAINSMELDWDAEKILICDNNRIYEINADGSGEPKEILKPKRGKVHDACRLPDGRIIFAATSFEQAVPCTGYAGVANLHIANGDGTGVRRLCYDQDYNWHPTVMENGRVMFLRWEYTSSVHYFSRILMTMNPDGTDQVAHYGSNSYWPNTIFWPRQLPGQGSRFLGIVSGHHGVHKEGELHLFDVAKGRFEADGAYHQVGHRGRKVKPIILDQLVDKVLPRYVTPFPLGTNKDDGSGKYFLATVRTGKNSGWGLYLVDIFDNMTLIKKGDYAMARPFVKTKKPPARPDRVDVTKTTANVVISDIYTGPGLKDIERGAVKRLRVGSYVYRYPGNGDTFASAAEGGWDVKMIHGTVPVEDDGSVSFVSSVNRPIFVQPLNAEGQALQLMRSWFVPMPGSSVSCIGCHESQNEAPPARASKAMRRAPSKIEEKNGPMRGFGFVNEVQPVLSRKCVGCHDGSDKPTLSGSKFPNFRADAGQVNKRYSRAYIDLQRYVRRAGIEADHHLFRPTEFMPDTSHLVKMLKKGHYNVKLTANEWERLYNWIDYNIPFASRWGESHRKPGKHLVKARAKYQKLYANLDDRTEEPLPAVENVVFEKPGKAKARKKEPSLKGWPFEESVAKQMQSSCALEPLELDLGDGIKLSLTAIPAGNYVMGSGGKYLDEPARKVKIDKPFYIGTAEVTLQQYNLFDKEHENGFIEARDKDRISRGVFDMNQPDLPVVRITQKRAKEFCKWLAKKTGKKVSLPTEEQWEWAARAGCGDGNYLDAAAQVAGYNIINEKENYRGRTYFRGQWNYGRIQKGHKDPQPWVEKVKTFTPNAWGVYNVLGNVSEWTDSDYAPVPQIGITDEAAGQLKFKVVRGGSWNDTAAFATLSSRWRYTDYQPVYNVGFRVVVHP